MCKLNLIPEYLSIIISINYKSFKHNLISTKSLCDIVLLFLLLLALS